MHQVQGRLFPLISPHGISEHPQSTKSKRDGSREKVRLHKCRENPTEEKPGGNSNCAQIFPQKTGLSVPETVPGEEKPQKCSDVRKHSPTSHISSNTTISHGRQTLQLRKMWESFSREPRLTIHSRAHTGEALWVQRASESHLLEVTPGPAPEDSPGRGAL